MKYDSRCIFPGEEVERYGNMNAPPCCMFHVFFVGPFWSSRGPPLLFMRGLEAKERKKILYASCGRRISRHFRFYLFPTATINLSTCMLRKNMQAGNDGKSNARTRRRDHFMSENFVSGWQISSV